MGTKKRKKQKGREQGEGWRQVRAGHPCFIQPSGCEAAAKVWDPHTRSRLLCTLTSSAGGKDSLPGKASARFHGLRHPKNPVSLCLVCTGSGLSL